MPSSSYQVAAAKGPCKPMCEVTVPEGGGPATRRYFVLDASHEIPADDEDDAVRMAAALNTQKPSVAGHRRAFTVTEAIIDGLRVNRHVSIDVDADGNELPIQTTLRLEIDSPIVNLEDAFLLATLLSKVVGRDVYRWMPDPSESDSIAVPSLPSSDVDDRLPAPAPFKRPTL